MPVEGLADAGHQNAESNGSAASGDDGNCDDPSDLEIQEDSLPLSPNANIAMPRQISPVRFSNEGGKEGVQVRPTSLNNPDDIPSALPTGRVKMIAFVLLFFLWVGGWSFLDLVADQLAEKYGPKGGFIFYGGIFVFGTVGLKVLALRYKGYALLDEVQEMI
mmetsp:Transcript_43475/g.102439  ORF Transcript_43475/g.102439 Transcript_43475/m.102439 type:complete len:162 (+) Transcript_43475:159-644(+)